MPSTQNYEPAPRRAIFDLQTKFVLTMNLALAEKMVDLITEVLQSGIRIPNEIFALYKKLEAFVGPMHEADGSGTDE